MKQLNPMLLLILLVSILVFTTVFIKYENNRTNLIVKKIETNRKIAKQIITYKKIWENRSFYNKKIKIFLSNLNSKHIKYNKNNSQDTMTLIFPKINQVNSRYVLSSILNQNFKIKSLHIERLDESHLKIITKVAR